MSENLPGPHGYLTCEDAEYEIKKYRRGLDKIMSNGCIHCSAWETAAGSIGATYIAPKPVPDSRDRFIEKLKQERDQARADVKKLRKELLLVANAGLRSSIELLAETDREEYKTGGDSSEARNVERP